MSDRPTLASANSLPARPAQPAAPPVATPEAPADATKLARSTPAPAPKGAAKPAATRSTAATLQISAVPAAKVTVDGRPVGTTPRTVRVEPGLHRVAFIGPNGRRSRNVNVPSGGNVNVAVQF
jgi:hypothetical protein